MFASGKKNSSYKGLKKTYKGSQYQFDIFLLIFQPTYSDPFDFVGGVPAPAAGWGPAGTERGGVSMAGGREGQSARKGEWGETIETNWSREGLRLKSDNLRRCCRLQDRGAVQGRSES